MTLVESYNLSVIICQIAILLSDGSDTEDTETFSPRTSTDLVEFSGDHANYKNMMDIGHFGHCNRCSVLYADHGNYGVSYASCSLR